jgi:hypothetical protein
VVLAARDRLRRAAGQLDAAVAELHAAAQLLEVHPDYLESVRRGAGKPGARSSETFTLAYWLRSCIRGVMRDSPLEDAASWARSDAEAAASHLVEFIADEERDLRSFARVPTNTKTRAPFSGKSTDARAERSAVKRAA